MKQFRPYLLIIALTSFLITSSFAQPLLQKADPALARVSAERLQRIDQMLKRSIDSGFIKGAIGYIARDGKIVYRKAFGVSDAGNNTAMKEDAIFRIASQTKAITSVAVMMLFEEGRLLLDDPVSRYIPSFAKSVVVDKFNQSDTTYTTVPAKREITIRDLLTHTSGIDYGGIGTTTFKAIYGKAGIGSGLGDVTAPLNEVINKLGTMPLAHQPGERFTYGLNTDVLGRIVEVISGTTLDKFFSERIFRPLGMNDTYFYLPSQKQSRLVTVYTLDEQQHVIRMDRPNVNYPNTNGVYLSGGAGLSSTINDYGIFLQMLLNKGIYNGKRLLAPRTVELMTMNQIGDLNVGNDKFGLGFQITTERGSARVGLSKGSFAWGGYYGTTYWVDPQERLVCLLFIQQTPLRGDVQDKFRAMVYQSLVNDARESVNKASEMIYEAR